MQLVKNTAVGRVGVLTVPSHLSNIIDSYAWSEVRIESCRRLTSFTGKHLVEAISVRCARGGDPHSPWRAIHVIEGAMTRPIPFTDDLLQCEQRETRQRRGPA